MGHATLAATLPNFRVRKIRGIFHRVNQRISYCTSKIIRPFLGASLRASFLRPISVI